MYAYDTGCEKCVYASKYSAKHKSFSVEELSRALESRRKCATRDIGHDEQIFALSETKAAAEKACEALADEIAGGRRGERRK